MNRGESAEGRFRGSSARWAATLGGEAVGRVPAVALATCFKLLEYEEVR